jgi:hypothetical protein
MATLGDLSQRNISYNVRLIPGKWIEFSLGIFLLSTPKRESVNGQIYRQIEAYDGLVILEENKTEERIVLAAGRTYHDFILEILNSLNIIKWNIEYSSKTAVTSSEWEIGTSYLRIINDCLAALNYTPLFVDEYGYFTSRLYRSPQEKAVDVEYVYDEFSVMDDGMEEELDLFSVPNKFIVVLNDPERSPLKSIYENTNADSLTSYAARGNRWIVDYREVEEIADQEALDAYTERIAFEASQIFGKVMFETALMPIHEYSNVLQLTNETLGIDGKYAETNWKMPLEIGGKMTHECRVVVNI